MCQPHFQPSPTTGWEASGIENVLDLANFTPSLSVAENPAGGGFLFIRGIGSNLLGAGADPGVAVYHDGADIARHVVAFQDFIDVERVEVLRGPQGTLYGRNATGGAVNIIHKKPTEDFTFSTRLDAGNFDKQGVAIAVSGKLIEDKLFGRASFSRQTKESYSTNVFLNDTQDGEDSENAVVTLVFKPTDNVEAVLRYSDFQDADPANNTTPIRNASNAEVFGVELEGVAALTRYSRVDLALTHLDSEYKNFDNALDPFTGDEVDFSGESLVLTPDLKLSVGAEYLFPLGDLGSLTVRGEYLYQDKQRFDLSFNPFLEGGEYEYFNARLTWADISGNFYIAAWGQNLNDDVYENSITFASVIGGLAVYASPRTYGITLGYNY